MTAVNHPCIVRCYGMLEPSPGIVLELVEGSSLFQIVHGERGESFMMVCAPPPRARAAAAGRLTLPPAVPAEAAVGGPAALPPRLRLRPEVLPGPPHPPVRFVGGCGRAG
jgi:hypothetical protein